MALDGVVCFQNPKQPLMLKAGTTRHWMQNLSDLSLQYKLAMESPNSSFTIDASQVTGEIPARGQISIIITRKPGRAQEDKLTIEYSGGISGRTVTRVVPIE
ncbi:hypothetical protein DICVIV_04515 [Dictyocaulus viviparus]|uniref:MSP domain-containing protein n=1 Tax=Dictyocaulus viviparus TaxID=29172 RepID=A0A0D8XY05_DICVI|nr:hypothetical protein DICVIV_04515 [Dictyocaulus viviparus]